MKGKEKGSSFLEIAILWPAKKTDGGCVGSGVVVTPCPILLSAGTNIAVFKCPPKKDGTAKAKGAPTWLIKIMPPLDDDGRDDAGGDDVPF